MKRSILPQMQWKFIQAADMEFHKEQKKSFYAWQYGNYKAAQEQKDFFNMYISGGEL